MAKERNSKVKPVFLKISSLTKESMNVMIAIMELLVRILMGYSIILMLM